MNIHEYQARELFERFGVATPKGVVADTPEQALEAARSMNLPQYVIKAQIHAGGRGKGRFKSGLQGGVHVVNTPEQVKDLTSQMLNQV